MSDPDKVAAFTAVLRKDLSSFIQQSFATVDPGTQYVHEWYVDAIAYQLDRVARGEITRLIITMPPRTMKSISGSVAFPAYLLGHYPRKKLLTASYADGLAEKLALDCQKFMMAPWYQRCFPQTRIARGRSSRRDFETTLGGGRFSTSIGGTVTGRGGDIIIIDDPHKPDEATSDAKRNAVLDWYRSTLLSRLNDPVKSAIILIQQRVHEEDLAGMLLEQGGWTHLNLPAIAEERMEFPMGPDRSLIFIEGIPLFSGRLPPDLLERRRKELGSYVYAAQYQQRPAPLGGGLVKWSWFRTYDEPPTRCDDDRIVQSWDTACNAEEANDYSVCTTWLVRGASAWLLDVIRTKLEFPQLRRRIIKEAGRWDASLVLIEQAGSGISLYQDLYDNTLLNVRGVKPRDDKATRLLSVTPLIECGRIAIPKEAPWLAEFQREIVNFPRGKHDDQVDSLSQFLKWLGEPDGRVLIDSIS
ncbi:phage terminase large subunit [Oceanicola sp. 502str15]|uniref:phage terminase large subunit n=1 Tax=Oceanicola sp. 502str15 TaxID=2696061 RepID=UPI002095E270|nr:phage terminase large subunit [Oceanicola sp. 502str15]MCO6384926.1 phage terminase large subunit [Oceanicola sp. 502str15]